MHDIRLIRDDPAGFDASMARRGLAPVAATLIAHDERRREAVTQAQEALTTRNALSKRIGAVMARGDRDEAARLKAEVAELKDGTARHEAAAAAAGAALDEALGELPNVPAADVPAGADEADNVVVREWGSPPAFAFAPREHDAIAPALGMDFETGVALAGARFTLLRGPVARLSRALGQFMLGRLVDRHGFEEIAPPLMVRDDVAYGTGQLPKFAEDLFRTTDGRWLISTSEMALTNIVRDRILAEEELPLRLAALTPCFRSEAGAAGRDTRGLIRQHQFDKVEMVAITTPQASDAENEAMTGHAEAMLEALELPYRRVKLCTGDMGFTAARTYDLEVWLPGQQRYREISSCSTCTDFQARRMNARYRPGGEKATRFVHTLNGSALAVGRTLVAVIENYQQADGSVAVPAALVPLMGGIERLTPADA